MRVPRKGPKTRTSGYAAPRPTASEILALKKQFNQTGTEFLRIDLATALTFAGTARHANDPTKRVRNLKSARRAYDTVSRMMKKVSLSDVDAKELTQILGRLKSELVELGEVF